MNTLADSMPSRKANLATMAMPEQALTLRADINAFYEAGYRDGSINYELEHCPACKNVANLQEALAENARLMEQIECLQPKDCEGNVLDIADKVSMLRSEYDGDHEWDDVVVELALTKWGGDRWIVRGSKGEAWACDCTRTGYDEDAYECSDDVEPIANPTLVEAENAELRSMVQDMRYCIKRNHRCDDCDFNVGTDCLLFVNINRRMRELGIEVDG